MEILVPDKNKNKKTYTLVASSNVTPTFLGTEHAEKFPQESNTLVQQNSRNFLNCKGLVIAPIMHCRPAFMWFVQEPGKVQTIYPGLFSIEKLKVKGQSISTFCASNFNAIGKDVHHNTGNKDKTKRRQMQTFCAFFFVHYLLPFYQQIHFERDDIYPNNY